MQHNTPFCKADVNALRAIMEIKHETQLHRGATDLRMIINNEYDMHNYVNILRIDGVEAPWVDYDRLMEGIEDNNADVRYRFIRGEHALTHRRGMCIKSKGDGNRRRLTLMLARWITHSHQSDILVSYDQNGGDNADDYFRFVCHAWVIDEDSGTACTANVRYMCGRIVIGEQIQFVFNVNQSWQERDAGTVNALISHSMSYRKYHVSTEESLLRFFYSQCVREDRQLVDGTVQLKKLHGLGLYHELHTEEDRLLFLRHHMYEHIKHAFMRCGRFAGLNTDKHGEVTGVLGFDCGATFSGRIVSILTDNEETQRRHPGLTGICMEVGSNDCIAVSYLDENANNKLAVLIITPHLEFVFKDLILEKQLRLYRHLQQQRRHLVLRDIVHTSNELIIHESCNEDAVNFSLVFGGTGKASRYGDPNHPNPALRMMNPDVFSEIQGWLGAPTARRMLEAQHASK